MNKIIPLMLFLVLLLPVATALDFDNIKQYNKTEKLVTVKNAFGLGSELAKIRLVTDLNVQVLPGPDRKVAELDFYNFDRDYGNALKDMEFFDLNKGFKEIERQFTYKYKVIKGTEQIPVYKQVCVNKGTSTNGSIIEECSQELDYYENRKIIEWVPFDSIAELPEGTVRVGIFTDVEQGDYVDWVPTLFGVRIPEWATWKDYMNVGLKSWWNMEQDPSVSDMIEQRDGIHNLSYVGTPTSVTGIIGNGLNQSGGEYERIWEAQQYSYFNNNDMSISMWVKFDDLNTHYYLAGGFDAAPSQGFYYSYQGASGDEFYVQLRGSSTCTPVSGGVTMSPGDWYHVGFTYDGSNVRFYVNGTEVSSVGCTVTVSELNQAGMRYLIGAAHKDGEGVDLRTPLEGVIDEVGIWNRTLNATEMSDLYNNGAAITYTAETPTPPGTIVTNITSPDDGAIIVNNRVNFTADVTPSGDFNNTNATLYVWNSTNDLIVTTTNVLSGNDTSVTNFLNQGTFIDATNYKWNVEGCGLNATDTLCDYGNSNRTFTIDTTAPVISINYPLPGSNITITELPHNVSFNASIEDITLDTCTYWTDEINVNVSYTCNTEPIVQFNNSGSHIIYAWANDSTGAVAISSTSFLLNFISVSSYASPTVIEGANSTFYLNVTADQINSVSADLIYNNTEYNFTTITSNSTFARLERQVTAPLVTSNQLVPYVMNYTIDGDEQTAASGNQIVYNIAPLDVQTTACTDAALQFSLKDEQNFTNLNGTFEYNFAYGTSNNNTLSRTFGSISNTHTFYVCINATISPTWELGDGQVFYQSDGYVERRYYLYEGSTLSNDTNNITLYDLIDSEQTSFKLEVEDTSLNPYIEKFTGLLRWYPQLNEYRVVGMGQTDEKGDTVLHVEAEDVDYRVGVYERNGTLIKLEDPTRFVCLINPCTYTLRISPTDADLTSIFDVDYTFDYNESTSIWSFVYSDSSQRTSGINLTVYKVTGTSTYPICSSASSSYSGAVTCNTSSFSGQLKGVVERSASPAIPLVQKIIQTTSTAFSSQFGLMISLLIGLPIAFVFAMMSPVAAIIGGIISLIPALYLGAVNWTIVGGIAVLGGITMHFLKRVG